MNPEKSSNNHINIALSNLDNIPNYSANNLICDCLEFVQTSFLNSVVSQILDKLGPNGILHLSIYNMRYDIKKYMDNKLEAQSLLSTIKKYNSIINLDYIMSLLNNQQFTIQQVEHTDNRTNIYIMRQAL